jgi:DNA-binding IclR family transcriptional regulator
MEEGQSTMRGETSVKSAARVLDIFELLRESVKPLTQTEISRKLMIPMSSLHAILRTLTSRRYLEEDRPSRTYRLGPALIGLVVQTQESVDLIGAANGIIEDLCNVTRESVSIGILENRMIIFIHKKVPNQVVQVVNPIGTRHPAHATALGKCILANMNEAELLGLYPLGDLPLSTVHTITKREVLLSTLRRVRAAGCAYDREESSLGVFAVGSPIFDGTGKAIAAVSVAAPSARATKENVRRWRGLVKSAAEKISAQLGYRGA